MKLYKTRPDLDNALIPVNLPTCKQALPFDRTALEAGFDLQATSERGSSIENRKEN